ncbi:MAG: hypothetical protein CMJ81_22825 [Planctomycetaceae bacterium]|nr:hypothetical protein [Planctomycetaceae bacterium]MBP61737.1 hypothetical protein [Planctomycetaceae bacterium]
MELVDMDKLKLIDAEAIGGLGGYIILTITCSLRYILLKNVTAEDIEETHQFVEGMSWMKKRSKMKLTNFRTKRSGINEMLTLTINVLHFRNVNG